MLLPTPIKYTFCRYNPPFLAQKYTFSRPQPRRKCRVSHTHFQQLSSPAASEVASSEVSATAEVKFAPLVAQVNDSLGRT